jgi:tetratricopeptide (TPR) repeat protein
VDEAVAVLERALEIDPTDNVILRQLAVCLARQGQFDRAFAITESALQLHGRWSMNVAYAGIVYAIAGQRDAALQCAAELITTARDGYVPAERLAAIYASLGELHLAFEWAEKSFTQRDPFLVWINVNPLFDALRSDARYQELLRKMNLS